MDFQVINPICFQNKDILLTSESGREVVNQIINKDYLLTPFHFYGV